MPTQVSTIASSTAPLPGEGVPLARMPAHWMLARLGKKVMRPGGLTPSLHMLAQMWTTFRRYRDSIGAVVMTARRP